MVITPEDHARNDFTAQLVEMRKTADPQIVNGVQKAQQILGESPQEIMAKCVNELRNPGSDRADLSPEQLAALPKDYKLIGSYLKMLQEAQVIHDKDLTGNNPFGDASPEDLRATMLKGALDYSSEDVDLRKRLIRAFLERCPTFIEEVLEVANEVNESAGELMVVGEDAGVFAHV